MKANENNRIGSNSFLLPIFFIIIPFNSYGFLSCRPFVVNATLSTVSCSRLLIKQ